MGTSILWSWLIIAMINFLNTRMERSHVKLIAGRSKLMNLGRKSSAPKESPNRLELLRAAYLVKGERLQAGIREKENCEATYEFNPCHVHVAMVFGNPLLLLNPLHIQCPICETVLCLLVTLNDVIQENSLLVYTSPRTLWSCHPLDRVSRRNNYA